MRKKLVTGILVGLIVLVAGLTGCQGTGGVAQEVYDRLQEEYENLKEQITELQDAPTTTTTTTTPATGTNDCDEQLAALQSEIDDLNEQYVLEGDTKRETAENIVRFYHETHEYSKIDLFMCSDMASEVWNMLKRVGIDSVIAIGDIDGPLTNIIACDHAWVLAEVEPGVFLALETTAGYSVPRTENQYYYEGWYFSSPADLKSYNEKIRTYNTLVGVRNTIADGVNDAIELYNGSSSQAEADKYMLLYESLKSLKEDYEAQLDALKLEIEVLASQIIV